MISVVCYQHMWGQAAVGTQPCPMAARWPPARLCVRCPHLLPMKVLCQPSRRKFALIALILTIYGATRAGALVKAEAWCQVGAPQLWALSVQLTVQRSFELRTLNYCTPSELPHPLRQRPVKPLVHPVCAQQHPRGQRLGVLALPPRLKLGEALDGVQ